MAKLGKLTKLKSAVKRWPSLSRLARGNRRREEARDRAGRRNGDGTKRPVYVGKSRRRYDVDPSVFDHPIFQELLGKSSWLEGGGGGEGGQDEGRLVVACEVVLFEHLVWMLENEGGNDDARLGSMDELVGFYTCR
ncbi:hypothetical protein MLD38_004791 [Melastoma candidum]|uniref:Uncharacterized protein n=1 Tax=Melastoma candidum TaxID=119954 RepID=A0ACB9S7P2_9MYRT|nr:hypothetical protein MLD38_004791 [Melastoma candidum]